MSIVDRQETLKTKLLTRTQSGLLSWTPDAEENSYSVILKPDYVARVKWPDADNFATLAILNGKGQEIFSEQETIEEPAKGVISLWHAARNNALGVDKAFDDILSNL
jgi:hypothetical protein